MAKQSVVVTGIGLVSSLGEGVETHLRQLAGASAPQPIIEAGGSWFGKTKSDCLGCHAVGKPKRGWAGVNTLPDNLRR